MIRPPGSFGAPRADRPSPGDEQTSLAELLAEVRRIQAQSSRLVSGVMAGGYHSVFRGAGIEFDEIREYVPGDDPRNVDWNVTARSGRPFVKEYVEERELSLLFALDLSASMDGGHGHWTLRQMAARICACLALSAVQNDDRVGLLAFSDRVDKFVPPRKGSRHVLRIVRDCLALPGSSRAAAGAAIGDAVEFVARTVRRHAVVFVVSDFLGEGWAKPLARAARRHDVVAVRLLPPELELPPRELAGLTRLRDPETGRVTTLDWRSRRVRAAWRERVATWQRRTDRLLRSAEIDSMHVPVPRTADRDAVVKPILEFFHLRELRGSRR